MSNDFHQSSTSEGGQQHTDMQQSGGSLSEQESVVERLDAK